MTQRYYTETKKQIKRLYLRGTHPPLESIQTESEKLRIQIEIDEYKTRKEAEMHTVV